MAFQGVDVRGTGDRLLFRVLLLDSAGAKVTSGTATLRLYELQSDGTFKSYDFNDNTFKTGTLTTATVSLTHRLGNNGTVNTGVWTYALTTVTGFTKGNIYFSAVTHTSASPPDQVREVQYGHAEGDVLVSTGGGTVDLAAATAGFGAASPDNLFGNLRAAMRKDATTPASIGTYNPATDSLEAKRELEDLMAGAGFATSTDSLAAIRDAIDLLVAPLVVTGGTSLSGTGFLSECVSLVRKAVDEPSLGPKYTDADVIEYIHAAFDDVVSDINVNSDHPILVRYTLPLVAGTQDYLLPANCGEVWRVAKINTTTLRPDWEIYPSTEFAVSGAGFSLEGNKLRLLSKWTAGETVEVLYVPTGEPFIHKGTASDPLGLFQTNVITLATTPTDGTLDTRANAYAGYMVRILSDLYGVVQERIITTYNNTTKAATVSPPWSPLLDSTTVPVVYEVVPQYSRLVKHVVILKTALAILANEGNTTRMSTIKTELQSKMRAMRLILEKMQSRFPHRFDSNTVDNPDRVDYWEA